MKDLFSSDFCFVAYSYIQKEFKTSDTREELNRCLNLYENIINISLNEMNSIVKEQEETSNKIHENTLCFNYLKSRCTHFENIYSKSIYENSIISLENSLYKVKKMISKIASNHFHSSKRNIILGNHQISYENYIKSNHHEVDELSYSNSSLCRKFFKLTHSTVQGLFDTLNILKINNVTNEEFEFIIDVFKKDISDEYLKNKLSLRIFKIIDTLLNKWLQHDEFSSNDWKKDFKKMDLRAKRNFSLVAVRIDGRFLEFADMSLKNDQEIVFEAVGNNGLVLEFAHQNLKKNREIVLAALENTGAAIQFADESLKKVKNIALIALKKDDAAWKYIPDHTKQAIVLDSVIEEKIESLENKQNVELGKTYLQIVLNTFYKKETYINSSKEIENSLTCLNRAVLLDVQKISFQYDLANALVVFIQHCVNPKHTADAQLLLIKVVEKLISNKEPYEATKKYFDTLINCQCDDSTFVKLLLALICKIAKVTIIKERLKEWRTKFDDSLTVLLEISKAYCLLDDEAQSIEIYKIIYDKSKNYNLSLLISNEEMAKICYRIYEYQIDEYRDSYLSYILSPDFDYQIALLQKAILLDEKSNQYVEALISVCLSAINATGKNEYFKIFKNIVDQELIIANKYNEEKNYSHALNVYNKLIEKSEKVLTRYNPNFLAELYFEAALQYKILSESSKYKYYLKIAHELNQKNPFYIYYLSLEIEKEERPYYLQKCMNCFKTENDYRIWFSSEFERWNDDLNLWEEKNKKPKHPSI